MYQALFQLVVTQITPYVDVDGNSKPRNLILTIPFIHSYHGHLSWANQCSTMSFELSKTMKIVAQNNTNGVLSLATDTVYIGNYTDNLNGVPTFLKGDMITFNVGYRTKLFGNGGNEITYMTGGADPLGAYPTGANIPDLFQGFIAKVTPTRVKKGKNKQKGRSKGASSIFTLECEDAMWLLKQIPTTTKQHRGSNIPDIVEGYLDAAAGNELLQRYAPYFTLKMSPYYKVRLTFNVADLWTQQGSVSAFLTRMKSEYKIYSYFRGYELRIGLGIYIQSDAVTQNFAFMKNIFDGDHLEFKRKDDEVMSVDVKSTYAIIVEGKTTKEGAPLTKKTSTEVIVYVDAQGKFNKQVKEKNVPLQPFMDNETGTRFSYPLFGVKEFIDGKTVDITNPTTLYNIGVAYLKKHYYDGLHGSFTTFGIPYVKWGDVVNITSEVLPEINGMYMVKSVEPYGGAEQGIRQTITLDFKINDFNDIESFA